MLKSSFQKIWLFIVSSILCTHIISQQVNGDSLLQIWNDTTLNDRLRIEAYYAFFNTSVYMDEVQFQTLASEAPAALKIAEVTGELKYIGFLNLMNGYYYREQEDREDISCSYFRKGIDLLLEVEEDKFIIESTFRLPTSCAEISTEYIDSSLLVIEKRLDPKDASMFYTTMGHLNYSRGNFTEACDYFKLSIDKGQDLERIDWLIFSLIMLKADFCQNYSSQELNSIIEELEFKINNSDMDLESVRYNNNLVQNYYDNSEMFPEAISAAQRVIQLSEKMNKYDQTYAHSVFSIGRIHSQIGNYTESEKYLLHALALADSLNDLNLIGGSHIQLANLYVNKNNVQNAKKSIRTGLEIMKDKKQCEPCYLIARITQAGIFNLEQKYKLALDELQNIKSNLVDIGGYENNYPDIYKEMGKSYLGLKQYSNAIRSANLGLNETLPKSFKVQKDLNEILFKAYEKQGDFESSLIHFKKMIEIKDSLVVLRNSEEVTRIELEKQFAEERLADSLKVAQQELNFQAELNKQKITKNYLLVIGLALLGFAIAVYSRLQYIKKTELILKQQNEIIEEEKEKAQSSERAKHQFLANMSHEIRTPMNAIKGMTDILIRRNPQEEQKEFLHGIKQSSDSLLVIINDILDLSKIEAGKIELEQIPFNLDELLQGVYTIMKFKAEEKGLQLNVETSGTENNLIGDPARLRQVLINLVGNAIKFTNKGVVNVRTKSVEETGSNINIQFTVSDTGVGIAEEHLNKIFNSFEQEYSDTSRKFGGTGLGLSISKRLVELNNGTIWAESQKGQGSQFYFIIPFGLSSAPENVDSIQTIAPTDKIYPSNLKILLVEDNHFNAVVAQEELEDAIKNVQIDLAENGSIAVEKLRSNHYDLILMDVQMPVMNGYEATKKIRSLDDSKSETKIIAMTANVLKEEIGRCFEAGMDDFIGKPFETEELLNKIFSITMPLDN